MRIYISLKVYILPTINEDDLCSSSIEYCSISNVNSLYQCCCKQCCAIAVYAMCYSVINPCGHWTSGTLSALASNGNTLYNVMGVKRHIMPVDLPHFGQKRIFDRVKIFSVCSVHLMENSMFAKHVT